MIDWHLIVLYMQLCFQTAMLGFCLWGFSMFFIHRKRFKYFGMIMTLCLSVVWLWAAHESYWDIEAHQIQKRLNK